MSVTTGSAQIDKIANNLAKAFKDGTNFKSLIDKLRDPGGITGTDKLTTNQLAGSNGLNDPTVKTALLKLIQVMYGAEVADKSDGKDIAATNGDSTKPVEVTIGKSKQFKALVDALKVDSNITGMNSVSNHTDVANKIKEALNAENVNPELLDLIKSMVDPPKRGKLERVVVAGTSANLEVNINDKTTNNLGTAEVSVTITGISSPTQNITIQVKGVETEVTTQEGGAIAQALALAITDQGVKSAAIRGSSNTIENMEASVPTIDGTAVVVKTGASEVKLQVKLHRSLVPGSSEEQNVATEIAKMIGLSLVREEVNNTVTSYTIAMTDDTLETEARRIDLI